MTWAHPPSVTAPLFRHQPLYPDPIPHILPLAQVEFIAGEGTVHRISWQDREMFIFSAERGAAAVGGLSTFFLVAFFIALECVLQLPYEPSFPSANSWHGIDHGEVQARSLPVERRDMCERPHLRGRNWTGRARKQGGQGRFICFFRSGFIFLAFDFVKLVCRGERWREPDRLQGRAQAGMPLEGGRRRGRRRKMRRSRKRR